MLTGTPLDLTVIPEIVEWLGKVIPIAWLLALVVALILVWTKAKTVTGRVTGIVLTLAVMVALPGWGLLKLFRQLQADQAKVASEQAEFRARYEKAEALFKKRCETAGEFIYKTVPDVKGLVWMKWRPKDINLSDQFKLDDPFGRDCGGDECFKELLVATEGAELRFHGEPWGYGNAGYEFIESVDLADGKLYRYRLRLYHPHDRDPTWLESAVRSELVKEPIAATTVQFGVTWDDLSTHDDRENWIAGGSLSVVDLKTKEVVAKRIGYMMDKGLGNEGGFRSPWSFAAYNACPAKLDEAGKMTRVGFTRRFVSKVLQPIKGAKNDN